jgi:hypothetical protein
VGAALADTPVKVALEAEVEARAKRVNCNRLFIDSQENSRKPKQLNTMFEELTRLKWRMNPFVLNVRNFPQYPEPLRSDPSASHLINGPTTVE